MLRMAIIGVGWAGLRQIQAIRELGRDVTVECVMDNDLDHLKSTVAELGILKIYTNYQAVLDDPNVDAISICTPHYLHCPMAVEAATAGKHILVEKPIAVTVAEATQMIEAAKGNGVKLYVAENWCYTPMAQFLRQVIQTGRYIGELIAAAYANGFRSQQFGYEGRRAWLTQPTRGGTGTWMLHGIHSMAQFRYILGEIDTVYLCEHKARSFERRDIEGTMSGMFALETGVHVSILQTSEIHLRHNIGGYTLYGDEGSIRAGKDYCEIFTPDVDKPPQMVMYSPAVLSDYALEIEAFAHYVRGTVMFYPTTGESERRSLAVVEAGYESARTGLPVRIREQFGTL